MENMTQEVLVERLYDLDWKSAWIPATEEASGLWLKDHKPLASALVSGYKVCCTLWGMDGTDLEDVTHILELSNGELTVTIAE